MCVCEGVRVSAAALLCKILVRVCLFVCGAVCAVCRRLSSALEVFHFSVTLSCVEGEKSGKDQVQMTRRSSHIQIVFQETYIHKKVIGARSVLLHHVVFAKLM